MTFHFFFFFCLKIQFFLIHTTHPEPVDKMNCHETLELVLPTPTALRRCHMCPWQIGGWWENQTGRLGTESGVWWWEVGITSTGHPVIIECSIALEFSLPNSSSSSCHSSLCCLPFFLLLFHASSRKTPARCKGLSIHGEYNFNTQTDLCNHISSSRFKYFFSDCSLFQICKRKDSLCSYLVHIGTSLGRGLHIAHTPLISTHLRLIGRHLPTVLQVRLVPHEEEGHVLIFLHSEDLLPGIRKQIG